MRTKIIATIGPKSETREILSKMIDCGVNVFRMNFSHCTFEEYIKRRDFIKDEARKLGREVFILMDLQGPRIRVGKISEEGLLLNKGEKVYLSVNEEAQGKIFIDEPSIIDSVEIGHPIYLSSGEMELTVTAIGDGEFEALVVRGGTLFSRKGVNVPESILKFSGLMEKDKKDLEFGLKEGVDYVAISFVQNGEDVRNVRRIVGNKAKIISKIESAQALKNIDEIIKESDSIMVARGDLGVEIPMERVPFVQKNLIRHAHWYNKGAIVATQMLLSMINNKKPTRAEVSDVANAVLDGADALMLSDESAGGLYPFESVEMMAKIIMETEKLFHKTDNLL